jgi:hypothetical protein
MWAITPEGKKLWYANCDALVEAAPLVFADRSVCFKAQYLLVCQDQKWEDQEWVFNAWTTATASPTVGSTGTIFTPGGVGGGSFWAVKGRQPLGKTPWPKFRGNTRNTGNSADSDAP